MVIDWFLFDHMTEVRGSSEGWFWRDAKEPDRVAGPYVDADELVDAVMCHQDRKFWCAWAEREGRRQ
jgi:hypothetical protein